MQLLELVIFAALAGVVLFQLYAVLGRRVGRQPEDAAKLAARPATPTRELPRTDEGPAAAPPSGLHAIAARDSGFEPGRFVDGARQAYAMIVQAYAAGDRGTLAGLTGPQVRQAFETGIDAREASGRVEAIEFLHGPRADLESGELVGDIARVKVRFIAEVRSKSRHEATGAETVEDRRTAEVWTFERSVNSRDPNWTLTRVDAAEH